MSGYFPPGGNVAPIVPIVCAQYDIVAPYVIAGDGNFHRGGAYNAVPLGHSVPPGGAPITDYFALDAALSIGAVKPGFYTASYMIEFAGLSAGKLTVNTFYLLPEPPTLPFGVGASNDLQANDGPFIGLSLPPWPIRQAFGSGGIEMPEFRSTVQAITVQHVYTTITFLAPWNGQGLPL